MKSRHLALGVAALFALAACDSKVQTSVPADSAPAASAAAAPAGLVEGQNYTVLSNPIPQQQAGKVEVLEFFGYFCPHCAHLEPVLSKHAKSFKDDMYLRTEHVVWQKEMLREINLFPEWFVAKELGRELTFKQRQLWQQTVDTLLPPLLAQPKVYVHRDFIVRNLMLTRGRPGVLDFQDALYGPISYDLVSLLRDAFIEWEEEFVLDLVIRYWEKARAAGLPVPEAFDKFYRWFEWMGVQRHLKVAGIFARLYYRDGKDKYRPEIPRFLNYLRRVSRRYAELAPLYALLVELVGDEELETGFTF